ncbi:MAG: hypothetical protein HQK49_19600 [Oligoflexia bacterium]|nr:hypothetical protein [Oligoflexia bacterium]
MDREKQRTDRKQIELDRPQVYLDDEIINLIISLSGKLVADSIGEHLSIMQQWKDNCLSGIHKDLDAFFHIRFVASQSKQSAQLLLFEKGLRLIDEVGKTYGLCRQVVPQNLKDYLNLTLENQRLFILCFFATIEITPVFRVLFEARRRICEPILNNIRKNLKERGFKFADCKREDGTIILKRCIYIMDNADASAWKIKKMGFKSIFSHATWMALKDDKIGYEEIDVLPEEKFKLSFARLWDELKYQPRFLQELLCEVYNLKLMFRYRSEIENPILAIHNRMNICKLLYKDVEDSFTDLQHGLLSFLASRSDKMASIENIIRHIYPEEFKQVEVELKEKKQKEYSYSLKYNSLVGCVKDLQSEINEKVRKLFAQTNTEVPNLIQKSVQKKYRQIAVPLEVIYKD